MEDICPLSNEQAMSIIKNLEGLKESVDNLKESHGELKNDHKSIKMDIQLINSKLSEMQLETAKSKSYSEGQRNSARFWFKAGILVTVTCVGAGILFVASVVTGKITWMDIFK